MNLRKTISPSIPSRLALVPALALALALTGCGEPSAPAPTGNFDLTVVATGIQSSNGQVRAVLCTEQEKFPNACAIKQAVPAASGKVTWEFKAVPAGTYAFAAFHDENDDNSINFAGGRMPSEGLMFSKNTMGRAGPPKFKQSAFELSENTKMIVKAKYF